MSYSVPVLLIFWRRSDLALRVVEMLRLVKPKYMYLACDGPRTPQEVKEVQDCRGLVENAIDWDCVVHERYSSANLGCKIGVSRAISWFFENVEFGLILEDDILVHHDFFGFAEEMLVRYRGNKNIGSISSASYLNYDLSLSPCELTYYITSVNLIWGWATWRDRWQGYSVSPTYFSIFKIIVTAIRMPVRTKILYLLALSRIKAGRLDTWDYQWDLYALLRQYQAIVPEHNMCTNIGFGDERASHTSTGQSPLPPAPSPRDSSASLEFTLSIYSDTIGKKYARFVYRNFYSSHFTFRIIVRHLVKKYIHM